MTSVVCLVYYIYIEGSGVIYYLFSAMIIFTVLIILKYGSYFIYHKEGFGLGDVKLGTVIGFILGWKAALIALFFGFLLAGIVILFLALIRKIERKSYIPFGPFMISGMFTYLFFGKVIINWYLSIILTH
jgi:leader peptidase (prepilin peptidase)/N-methyltransferase